MAPGRSRLYHLDPMQTSVGLSESLSSYVARLAAAHSVSVAALVQHEVGSIVGKEYAPTSLGYHRFLSIHPQSLDSMANRASECVQALAYLTGRRDLDVLTMLPWQGYLSNEDLLHGNRKWCPDCLTEWQEQGQPTHYPLLWSLSIVLTCHIHQQALVAHCPACSLPQPVLRARYSVGYCYKCGALLATKNIDRVSPRPDPVQLRTAEDASQLIDSAISNSGRLPTNRFVPNLVRLIRHMYQGKVSGFAELSGVPLPTARGWLRGDVPSLRSVFRVSYQHQTSPVDFLLGEPGFAKGADESSWEAVGRNSPRRVSPTPAAETALVRAFNDWPPPSLSRVARTLGCSTARLRRLFPDLCNRIVSRYADYRAERRKRKMENLTVRVNEAVDALWAQGILPTEQNVGPLVGWMYPELRSALYQRRCKISSR